MKERLIEFLAYLGIGQTKFEEKVGLSRGFVNTLKNNPTVKTLDKIAAAYPELNMNWLRIGEGNMLNDDTNATESENIATWVSLLPVSAQGGSLNDFVVSVKDTDCEKVVSPVRGADLAMPVSGDSMSPEYPNGSRIFIKKINEKAFIEWGKVYVLDTCNGAVIKILAPSDKDGYIRCVSINPDPIFAPFEVSMKDIYGVYKVLLCMSIK